jgi:triosephosphate isomerase
MSKPFIAGNWKMHGVTREAEELIMRLRELLKGIEAIDVIIAPPFTALQHIGHLLAGSSIKLCAQNIFWEEAGAYTGEISTGMLKDVGCEYVIIGHSERRCLFQETNEIVNRKILAALKGGLRPVLCVGETLKERECGEALNIVKKQVKEGLKGILPAQMKQVTIAYEPVWAIGTGKTATTEEAEDVHNTIREFLYSIFELESMQETRIIYGGSVKPGNIDSLMAQPNIDGVLVGGASLEAADFARIVRFQPL